MDLATLEVPLFGTKHMKHYFELNVYSFAMYVVFSKVKLVKMILPTSNLITSLRSTSQETELASPNGSAFGGLLV